MKRLFTALLGVLLLSVTLTSSASADPEDWSEVPVYTGSPEHFGLELRVGIYTPLNLGDAFLSTSYFGGDVGPMLSAEVHYFPERIRYIGLIGGGVGIGWSQWDTPSPGGVQSERNSFEFLNLRPMIVWRFDTFARELNVPVVLTPKFGLDIDYWQTGAGAGTEADGWILGLRFGGKVSLELDFLEPRAARQLDEEWGINHSEIFFEMYYSTAGELVTGSLPLSGWGWAAGLALTF